MKMLVILAIILAVLATYFVFNTEKSTLVKSGDSVVPAGVDIARFVLGKALNQSGTIKPKINDILQSKLTGEIKSKIGEIKDKILDEAVNLIKKPVQNKINETFCSAK